MHEMPVWYPYIDWDKSTLRHKVLLPDTPKDIVDQYEQYLKELEEEKRKGLIDK